MTNWRESIDVSEPLNNEALPFEQRRDRIVAALKASRWYRRQPELEYLVAELEAAEDADEWYGPWSETYNLADRDLIWLNPFQRRTEAATP